MGKSLKILVLSVLVATSYLCALTAKTNASQEIQDKVAAHIYAVSLPGPLPKIPAALVKVSFCESGGRQFYPDGKLVTGPDGHDRGRFQIRETVHRQDALKHGWDIDTDFGNTEYALWLYQHEGLSPWYSSKSCWSDPVALKEKGYNG